RRGVLAYRHCSTWTASAAAETIRVLRGIQFGLLGRRITADDLIEQRKLIEYPECPAFGADNHLLVPLVEGDVSDGRYWHVQLERAPVVAVVVGEEEAEFRTRYQKSFMIWVFADHPGECVGGNPGNDFLPRLPVVAGLVEIRPEIVELVIRR